MKDTELHSTPTEVNPPDPQAEPQIKVQTESQAGSQGPQPSVEDVATTDNTVADASATNTVMADTATDNAATTSTAAIVAPAKPKKSHRTLVIVAVAILAVLGVAGTALALTLGQNHSSDNPSNDSNGQSSIGNTPDRISDFDLAFLEDKTTNQLYSPLSIKYALGMLEVGAAGDSRQQIEDAIGSLAPQKYPNNKNMSFANALFINNKLPDDTIKDSYTTAISEQFGAEIRRVPFTSATPINNWVSDKTFGLIKDLVTDEMLRPVSSPEQYFALVNALAIDMEWINKIQPYDKEYGVSFRHINYSSYVNPFELTGFARQPFNNSSVNVNALHLAATVHKYDILSDLGVDKIRQTIIDKYTEWLNDEDGAILCDENMDFPAPEVYVEQYLEELGDGGYKTVSSSTDFSMYDDDEVKVFAKDLRTYDGITLQYVGIMPKTTSLKDYVKNLTTDSLTATIGRLKAIEYENFKDGVITDIVANIPVFKFQYKLDLVDALQSIGITDVFSDTKADLSNLANDATGLYIGNAVHQTTVDFSNDGIKASAATALVGGKGAGGCYFRYDFDVPVEKIDLTFDNPYLFLIRDKDSGAIWFVGTVYEPTIYTPAKYK